jgi:hypothetical protein
LKTIRRVSDKNQSSTDLDGPAVVDPNLSVVNLLVQLNVQKNINFERKPDLAYFLS